MSENPRSCGPLERVLLIALGTFSAIFGITSVLEGRSSRGIYAAVMIGFCFLFWGITGRIGKDNKKGGK